MTLVSVLQVIVGLGLLNVWLARASRATAYRGGAARTLREEFSAYGLPTWFFLLCGVLKVLAGVCLLVGLWMPTLVLPAASLVVVLMLGALAMHVKVQDPAVKSLPALLMLAMSAVLCGLTLSS